MRLATLFERPEDFLECLLMREPGGIDTQGAGLLIDGEAGFQQRVEGGAWVLHLEQRTLAAPGGALEEGLRIGMQPNHGPDSLEQVAVLLAKDGASARGEDDALGADKLLQFRGLAIPEAFLALLGEEVGDALARSGDDQIIAVEEVIPEARRQPSADAALAAAHEADEDDIGIHDSILRRSLSGGNAESSGAQEVPHSLTQRFPSSHRNGYDPRHGIQVLFQIQENR